jgi:hypothetical protein
VLALLVALPVCDDSATDPVAVAPPTLVGVAADSVAFGARTLVEAEADADWLPGTLTALPFVVPTTHFATSSLCS